MGGSTATTGLSIAILEGTTRIPVTGGNNGQESTRGGGRGMSQLAASLLMLRHLCGCHGCHGRIKMGHDQRTD
jgi:hypothetical protein